MAAMTPITAVVLRLSLLLLLSITLCCSAPARRLPSSRRDICSLNDPGQTLPADVAPRRHRRQITNGGGDFGQWPHGVIPYSLDPNLSKGGRHLRTHILRAMLLWSRKFPIIFVPHSTQRDFIRIVWGRRCCSMQGRQGGVQTVQIGRRCASPASLLHHLGHVMGLSVHGDGHTRSQQAQNQLLIGDMIHHVAELQAPSTESVMLLKYMELTNKAQRRLGLSKVVPGKFDVAVLGLKYAALTRPGHCNGRHGAKLLAADQVLQQITSPDYPEWYWHDVDCAWHIESQAGQRVVLKREMMQLEMSENCEHDYVEVADVLTGSTTRYCGNTFPATLVSASRFGFTVRFHSDSGEVALGFHISYHSVVDGCRGNKLGCKHACEQRPHGPVCACPAGERLWRDGKTCVATDRCATPAGLCHHGCRIEDDGFPTCTCRVGHVISADGLSCESCVYNITVGETEGSISSPNYPGKYPRNTDCQWHIHSADPRKLVVLHMDYMRIEQSNECKKDYLDLLFHLDVDADNDDDGTGPFYRICNNISRSVDFNSHLPRLILRLHTDSDKEFGGFRFRYSAISSPGDLSLHDIEQTRR